MWIRGIQLTDGSTIDVDGVKEPIVAHAFNSSVSDPQFHRNVLHSKHRLKHGN